MGKQENIELYVRGKEIHDSHIGSLKLFSSMNSIDFNLDKNETQFNYKKCLGTTVYKGKSLNRDYDIIIDDINYMSTIRESDLFEKLKLTFKLDSKDKLEDSYIFDSLNEMNGLYEMFSNLLAKEDTYSEIEQVADILSFYHLYEMKGRSLKGNIYTINTPSNITCTLKCLENFNYELCMTRVIIYSELGLEQPKPKVSNRGLFWRKRDVVEPKSDITSNLNESEKPKLIDNDAKENIKAISHKLDEINKSTQEPKRGLSNMSLGKDEITNMVNKSLEAQKEKIALNIDNEENSIDSHELQDPNAFLAELKLENIENTLEQTMSALEDEYGSNELADLDDLDKYHL